ncbi:MAG: acyl-CoA dehydrogenase family protein [Rhizomicrobium sp.]
MAHLLRLRLIDAVALSDIAEVALDMAYAGLREQFGRPIGRFLAGKHHSANMVIAARRARDQTDFAAVAIDDGRGMRNFRWGVRDRGRAPQPSRMPAKTFKFMAGSASVIKPIRTYS